jgi:putative NIF3 family GTP cyclohydrolase 1 type 2
MTAAAGEEDAVLTATDVATVFEEIAPRSLGLPDDELGFVFGDPGTRVRGVACMWNIHTRSLADATAAGLNLIICHEHRWLHDQTSGWYEPPASGENRSNRLRRELLERHGMVVYRSHSNWDALPGDDVPDQAVAALRIAGLEVEAAQRFFKVHRLPRPTPVRELRARAEAGLGFGACRLFGDGDLVVERFAFLVGGFGENQRLMPQAAVELGARALIIGETSEFIVVAALELGVPVIETLHSVSEAPAIRRQPEMLAARLPEVSVRYVESGALAFARA